MKYAIGLMSGTSLDGLDLALVTIDGVNETTKVDLVAFATHPYTTAYRAHLKAACEGALTIRGYCSLNFEIANYYVTAIQQFLQTTKVRIDEINFIASHGQTIYHLVDPQPNEVCASLQLGDGSVIANRLGVTTVSDFRVADLANGGQGAPIVCYSEYLLYRHLHPHVILQNIGGISNCTVLHKDLNQVFAFDNGPGNVMIDYVCQHYFDQPYDKDGKCAQQGHINQALLARLSNDPYYQLAPPKTTGREKYNETFIQAIMQEFAHLSKFDLLRTMTYFTAQIIIASYQQFIIKDDSSSYLAVITGGGASNPVLLADLIQLAPKNLVVKTGWDYNINTDAKEAIAMVVLGNQTLHGQPSNVPCATGALKSTILGKIAYPWKGQ